MTNPVRAWLPAVLALAASAAPPPALAAEHSVRPDGAGDFPTIQAAVTAAAPGDEIVLEDGTFTGPGNRDIDFGGKDLTVRSRNGAAACTLDTQGTPAQPHRAFHLHSGESAAARIAGLTITGGYTTGPFPQVGGAGILVEWNTHPTIEDCVFEGNESGFQGFGAGLLAWEGCNVTIRDCIFRNNVSGWYGGGFTLRKNCHGLVERCVIQGNYALHAGGGASITRSNAILNDCVFEDNWITEADGGGLLVKAEAMPVLTRCVFSGNRAPFGAAIGIGNFPAVTAVDCLFENNDAAFAGGGVEVGQDPSSIDLVNCTFAFNEAPSGAHVYFSTTGSGTVRNTIFGPYCGNNGIHVYGAIDIDCCVVPGGAATVFATGGLTWGASNVDADPRFCAPDPLQCESDPPVTAQYTLDVASPAAPGANPCGLVGAYPVACTVTAASSGMRFESWGRVKAGYRAGGPARR